MINTQKKYWTKNRDFLKDFLFRLFIQLSCSKIDCFELFYHKGWYNNLYDFYQSLTLHTHN
jgi:hypothetical protein